MSITLGNIYLSKHTDDEQQSKRTAKLTQFHVQVFAALKCLIPTRFLVIENQIVNKKNEVCKHSLTHIPVAQYVYICLLLNLN